jgi:sodium/potassium/calcium exchanger 6
MERNRLPLALAAILLFMAIVGVKESPSFAVMASKPQTDASPSRLQDVLNRRKLSGLSNSTTSDSTEDLPCSDILLHQTPQERCQHAIHCDGEYLMKTLLPLAFCMSNGTSSPLESHPIFRALFPILFPLLLTLSTVMLFRLLASTAENYFSPALEMISSEFQIPPPLAGVTLLALGNGSPDVSAVFNAIRSNPSEGIPLSLGELTGGGMFVQSVVVGRIVSIGRKVTGDEERGVICREELIRDMSMYAIAASYVFWMTTKETIYYRHVLGMFVLYSAYVLVVVAFEVRRYYRSSNEDSSESNLPDEENTTNNLPDESEHSCSSHLQTAPSKDEEDYATLELSQTHEEIQNAQTHHKAMDPPGNKQHSARIIRVIKIQQQRQQQRRRHVGSRPDLIIRRLSKPTEDAQISHTDLQLQTWSVQLFSNAMYEIGEHFYQVLYIDGCANTQLSKIERVLLLLEAPFVILRKLVTPLPCEGDYNRPMVAVSIGISPLWLCTYLTFKQESFDPFHVSDRINMPYVALPVVFWPCCVSFACGCAVLRYASENIMPLRYTVPVALYGFLIAATWIDVISDQLVNVLEFVGVSMRIPSPIIGMTVLAWGNSVGDYSTNSALAQKGFSDMR